MKNILINGLKAKAGGGKNIFDNFIKLLFESTSDHKYYVLTPDKHEYERFSKDNLVIVDVRTLFKINLFFPALYFFELPILLRNLKIDLIFNFGDVIIPSKIRQVYFFDWANAVYPDKYIWQRMSASEFIVSKMKVFLIRKYINRVKLTIAQTQNMANRLKSFYGLTEVVVIPTPVGIGFSQTNIYHDFNLPLGKKKFLFPASFSSHKNFEIIIPVGELIKKFDLPYIIVITIEGNVAKSFLKEINNKKLDCIINVGKVAGVNMPALYQQCDVLFLPTLLESFGLPYVEAMACRMPIITSDLDFAHDVCGDLAGYFNPFDANSILSVMQNIFTDEYQVKERIKLGKARIAESPDWAEVFSNFQKCIELALN